MMYDHGEYARIDDGEAPDSFRTMQIATLALPTPSPRLSLSAWRLLRRKLLLFDANLAMRSYEALVNL